MNKFNLLFNFDRGLDCQRHIDRQNYCSTHKHTTVLWPLYRY